MCLKTACLDHTELFNFQTLFEPNAKQCRPLSDTAFCNTYSGYSVFAEAITLPIKGKICLVQQNFYEFQIWFNHLSDLVSDRL